MERENLAHPVEEQPRGILNPKAGEQKFQLRRYTPAQELSIFVEHYWLVTWDLRGQEPYSSETLPHPSIHLVIEPDVAHIVGIVTSKFSRLLAGQGQVFGIKFNPGAFYPFVQTPIAHYTNKTTRLSELFGTAGRRFEIAVRAASSDAEKVAVAESFLHEHSPAYDENIVLVNQIVTLISAERTMTKVDHLAYRFNMNKRSLQRLFHQYVGVSPKWVIQRYRLHEAAERMASGELVDWSGLAQDLGYFDQAHFIKDFKAIVGLTPAEYAKKVE